jgi:glycosyltransferase involved in cell wall biosynthesis
MKVIALLPVKNEAWILSAYLSSILPVVDEIVTVDDGSSDRTSALIEAAGGHVVPARAGDDWDGHWGAIRDDLLRIGREHGGTHFVCLDADEALTAPARDHLREALRSLAPGEKLAMQWLALWKDPLAYRDDDSVWSDNVKEFAFADAEGYAFEGQWPHRHGRTPGPNDPRLWKRLPPNHAAVLHFQFVPWTRFQVKQAWYRCAELIRAPNSAYEINRVYAPTLDDGRARTRPVPRSWVAGVDIPEGIRSLGATWHWDEILRWFDEHGIEFFEPLQIWHVQSLRQIFVQRAGREPHPTVSLAPGRRIMRAIRGRAARIVGLRS